MKKLLLIFSFICFTALVGCGSKENAQVDDTPLSENAQMVRVQIGQPLTDDLVTPTEDVYVELVPPTSNAMLYYTFDNKKMPESFTLYVKPFKLPKPIEGEASKQLRVFVVTGDFDDGTVYFKSFHYNKSLTFAPEFSFFNQDTDVVISSKDDLQTIFYTFDDNAVTKDFKLYTGPLTLTGSMDKDTVYNLRAFALNGDGSYTDVFSKTYTIVYSDSAIPEVSHVTGIYNAPFYLTFQNKKAGSTIYYTLDGTTPNIHSQQYSQSSGILFNEGITTLKAIQIEEQHKPSPVVYFTYKIDPNFEENYDYADLTFDQIVHNFVGNWIGTRRTPWVLPQTAYFVFREDGTYSSYSMPGSKKEGNSSALYYGTDADSPLKTYALDNIDARGWASGEIQVVFGVGTINTSQIRKVRFSKNLDVLEFEYWHRGQYGPVSFKLYRF